MTELSANQIALLTSIVTGGDVKRAANKEAAIRRFRTVCDQAPRPIDAEMILSIQSFDEAAAALGSELKAGVESNAAENRHGKLGGAGLARLRANADAEALREQANKDAAAARAAVTHPAVAEPKDRAIGKDALGPKPKVEKVDKAETATTRSRIDTSAKIVAVAENPKKAGSRSHARYSLYKAGQTVEGFIAACAAAGYPESEAKADLSWDRRKGFIEIATDVPATGRPGDVAATYAQENGVSYSEALVACNMD